MTSTLVLKTKNLHLDDGQLRPAAVVCTPGQPLEVLFEGYTGKAKTLTLPDCLHIALAGADPHVHFRQSALMTRQEYAEDKFKDDGVSYEQYLAAIAVESKHYDAYRGSLAALKGGVATVVQQPNTRDGGAIGVERFDRTLKVLKKMSMVNIHSWVRMDPRGGFVAGQSGKDFGTTFGSKGISSQEREQMYKLWFGGDCRAHNDGPREESITAYRDRVSPHPAHLHHWYFDGETVLAEQRKILDLARRANLQSLTMLHIPTGRALEMILNERKVGDLRIPAEVGMDYLIHHRDNQHLFPCGQFNYRRPALPSLQDHLELITLLRDVVRSGDSDVVVGSDHAPHPWIAKQFVEGLPGSPGTRNIEHTLQVRMHLIHNHGYTHHDVDRLFAINPSKHIAQYVDFGLPTGTMTTGAMANLMVFDPDAKYRRSVQYFQEALHDPEYRSAYPDLHAAGLTLRGEMYYTVVNGKVWDVFSTIFPKN